MARFNSTSRKIIGSGMIAVMAGFSVLPAANAAVIGNEAVVSGLELSEARQTVDAFMARQDVQDQFETLGVDPEEARKRVEALDDSEVVALAEQIETAPAGQGAVGTVVGAAVLIFVVLLITDLLGFTDVFPFTNKGSANPS